MAQFANGVVIKVDYANTISGTPAYVTIGEVYDVSFGGLTADTVDATAHGDKWRRFIAALKDGGDATLSIHHETDNTGHANLFDNIGKGPFALKFEWPINNSSNTTPFSITTDAILTAVTPNAPHDDDLDLSATFKFSGAPVITDEAA
jgi:hypothetical protein